MVWLPWPPLPQICPAVSHQHASYTAHQQKWPGDRLYKGILALITPCHTVQWYWNEIALKKHVHELHLFIFQYQVEDRIKGQSLTLAECYAFTLQWSKWHNQKCHNQNLPDVIEIAPGMKVMVTQNVQTDLNITNRACGTIVGIKLSPEKPMITNLYETIQLHTLS